MVKRYPLQLRRGYFTGQRIRKTPRIRDSGV
nr:MAG TPA: hypothetical protein [Caudoviricetes sp.]DAO28988.1 MAG TPA: hypothetical protein [Caudoviricetes sp.]